MLLRFTRLPAARSPEQHESARFRSRPHLDTIIVNTRGEGASIVRRAASRTVALLSPSATTNGGTAWNAVGAVANRRETASWPVHRMFTAKRPAALMAG